MVAKSGYEGFFYRLPDPRRAQPRNKRVEIKKGIVDNGPEHISSDDNNSAIEK